MLRVSEHIFMYAFLCVPVFTELTLSENHLSKVLFGVNISWLVVYEGESRCAEDSYNAVINKAGDDRILPKMKIAQVIHESFVRSPKEITRSDSLKQQSIKSPSHSEQ